MNTRRDAAAVAIGGALGSMARIGIGSLLPVSTGMPWGTFIANIIGSAMLGMLVALPAGRSGGSALRMPFLGIGFCGGLTTFSTLCFELFDLFQRGSLGTGLAYASLSVVIGLGVAVSAHTLVSKAIASRRTA
ncbi:MAG: CrcB family protein [Solirubrobacterales bacterium]|nr:CrcB family protein [Solirubrobacterales bacterium]